MSSLSVSWKGCGDEISRLPIQKFPPCLSFFSSLGSMRKWQSHISYTVASFEVELEIEKKGGGNYLRGLYGPSSDQAKSSYFYHFPPLLECLDTQSLPSVDVFPGYSINFFYRFQVLHGEWTQTWLQLLPSTKPSFPTWNKHDKRALFLILRSVITSPSRFKHCSLYPVFFRPPRLAPRS